jgi:hypothetical protein
MHDRLPRSLLAPPLVLALWLGAGDAAAYERQWHAGASAGVALLTGIAGDSYTGYGGGLHLTYGLTDAFNAVAEGDFMVYPSLDGAWLGGGGAGVTYVLDVLQWVPYLGVTGGAYDFARGAACGGTGQASCHEALFGLTVPFGVDYQVSRSVAIGVEGKYRLLFADDTVHQLGALARVEYVWGY